MPSGAAGVASHVNRRKRLSGHNGALRTSTRDLRDSQRDDASSNDAGRASHKLFGSLTSSGTSPSENGNGIASSWTAGGGDNPHVGEQPLQDQHAAKEGSVAFAQDDGALDGDGNADGAETAANVSGFRLALRKVNQARKLCGQIVNHDKVQLFVILLIAINAIMMGVGTFDFVMDDPAMEAIFETVDFIFLIVFTIELCMQFVYHGPRLFLDGWLVFDFVVIVMSWSFAQVQIIRAFRIFRALRLVTRVAVMRNLVVALFAVMPRMGAIALLLVLLMYIFAVMFTQLFKYMYRDGLTEFDYFSNLGGTFFTLYQIMTLDAWADVARDVMETYPWAWLPFIIFVIISGFIVVNLIIAVICDAIATLHDDEKAALTGGHMEDESDDGSDDGDEDISVSPEEAQQQEIEALEGRIEELKKVQDETMKTLQFLTQHLQNSALAQQANKAEGRSQL